MQQPRFEFPTRRTKNIQGWLLRWHFLTLVWLQINIYRSDVESVCFRPEQIPPSTSRCVESRPSGLCDKNLMTSGGTSSPQAHQKGSLILLSPVPSQFFYRTNKNPNRMRWTNDGDLVSTWYGRNYWGLLGNCGPAPLYWDTQCAI